MNYRRIAGFSLCILLALIVPGTILAALLGWSPSLFGDGSMAMTGNFRLLEYALIGFAATFVYVWFLWPITKRLFAHALIAFLVVEALLLVCGLLLGGSIPGVFAVRAFLTDALYAVVGWVLVYGWRAAMKKGALA